jgi:DNA repair protein RecO (recombination protein O)
MRTIKTQAIVIGERNLPNKDKIIFFLTEDLGKVTVFAKGIKKITSHRLSHLDTGNLVKILIYKNKENFYLRQTELISGFSALKQDKFKINRLFVFLFVINKILPDNQSDQEIFLLAKKFLVALSKEKAASQEILLVYLNQLLIILGYSTEKLNFNQLKTKIEEIIDEKIPFLEYN